VTINGGPVPVRVSISEVSANVPKDDQSGKVYLTTLRFNLSGSVPKFSVAASAPTLKRINLAVTGMIGSGTTPDGFKFETMDNAFGNINVVLTSAEPEHFQITYECGGIPCVN
jgi:hypothetical protein